jgi:hypothetical protein
MTAKGDITLDSVTTGQSERIRWSSRNSRIDGSSSETGTTVSGGTNVAIGAGGDPQRHQRHEPARRAASRSMPSRLKLRMRSSAVPSAPDNRAAAQAVRRAP